MFVVFVVCVYNVFVYLSQKEVFRVWLGGAREGRAGLRKKKRGASQLDNRADSATE